MALMHCDHARLAAAPHARLHHRRRNERIAPNRPRQSDLAGAFGLGIIGIGMS